MVFKKTKMRTHRTVKKDGTPITPRPHQPDPGGTSWNARYPKKSPISRTRKAIEKTKFETLTNQQNTNVSQYVPATTMAAAVPASTPLWYDVPLPKSVRKPRRGRKIYPKPTAPPGGSGQIYLPDGAPYEPGATYQFHGDGTYTKIPGPMDGEEV